MIARKDNIYYDTAKATLVGTHNEHALYRTSDGRYFVTVRYTAAGKTRNNLTVLSPREAEAWAAMRLTEDAFHAAFPVST